MKKIVYSIDGNVFVVIPVDKKTLERVLGPLTEEAYVDHVIARSIPEGVDYRFIDDSDLPADREFRNAWVDVTEESKIDICCEKAKNISLAKLREKRNEKLEEKDKEFMIALERGLDTNNIKSEKQTLRDITIPLKDVDVVGKVNDEVILNKLRDLSKVLD